MYVAGPAVPGSMTNEDSSPISSHGCRTGRCLAELSLHLIMIGRKVISSQDETTLDLLLSLRQFAPFDREESEDPCTMNDFTLGPSFGAYPSSFYMEDVPDALFLRV